MAAEGDDNIPIENERGPSYIGVGEGKSINEFMAQPQMSNIEKLKGKYNSKGLGLASVHQVKRKPGYAPVETQPNDIHTRKNMVTNSRNSARSLQSMKLGPKPVGSQSSAASGSVYQMGPIKKPNNSKAVLNRASSASGNLNNTKGIYTAGLQQALGVYQGTSSLKQAIKRTPSVQSNSMSRDSAKKA